MRQYDVYLINEEVARDYFGQESKLFQLFLEETRFNEQSQRIVQKQIKYITQPIPALRIQKLLQQSLKNSLEYQSYKNSYSLKLGETEKAELTLQATKMSIIAKGNFEAETAFFEIIRKLSPCFFAVDVYNYRYGWVNPIKQLKLI